MDTDELNNIKAVLKSLVISSGKGVTVRNLQRDYCMEEGNEVPHAKFGFPTFEAFLRSIPDTVLVCGSGATALVSPVKSVKSMHVQNMVENQKNGSRSSSYNNKPSQPRYSRHKTPRTNRNFYSNTSSRHVPFDNASQIPKVKYIANTSLNNKRNESPNNFDHKISKLKLSNIVNPESRLTIFITEIHSPSMFWFHIHRNLHFLDILTEKMQTFYSALSWNELLVPNEKIAKDLTYAGIFNAHWNRVKILDTKNLLQDNEVVVRLIDFGSVITVNSHSLKYLLEEFAQYPEQALCGTLSYIEPINTKWTVVAVNAFLNMVNNNLVYARVTKIDNEKEQAHLIICQKDGERIIQVNNTLINNNHAIAALPS